MIQEIKMEQLKIGDYVEALVMLKNARSITDRTERRGQVEGIYGPIVTFRSKLRNVGRLNRVMKNTISRAWRAT